MGKSTNRLYAFESTRPDALTQDSAGGCFIHAAALHADEAVLHNVDATNAVAAADSVEEEVPEKGRSDTSAKEPK